MADENNAFMSILQRAQERGVFQPNPSVTELNLSGRVRLDEAQSAAQGLIQTKLRDIQRLGLPPNKAIQQLLNSEEFISAVSTPGLNATKLHEMVVQMVQSVQPALPKREVLSPGQQAASIDQTGKVVPGTERSVDATPSAAEQVVNGVIAAEKAGDRRRAELLLRSVPKDDSGQVPFELAVKLGAAGVKTTGNTTIDGLIKGGATQAQLQKALEVGRDTKKDGPTLNELAILAVRGDKIAQAALKVRAAMTLGNPQADALLGILAAVGARGGADTSALGGSPPTEDRLKTLDDLFKTPVKNEPAVTKPEQKGGPNLPDPAGGTPAPVVPSGAAATVGKISTMPIDKVFELRDQWVRGQVELDQAAIQAIAKRLATVPEPAAER